MTAVTKVMATLTAAQAAPAASAACSTNWGVKAKVVTRAEGPGTARASGVRAGIHGCFDRLVIDLGRGAEPGYRVRYVAKVHAEGSGKAIALPGHAALQITLTDHAAAKFSKTGHVLAPVAGFHVLRKVVAAGSFEGYTAIGVGVRAKLPFRVEWLKGPGHRSRLIIDIARN